MLVVVAAGVAISLLVWRPLVRWCRWRSGATLAALLLFTVCIALTLTPDGDQPAMGLDACIPADWNDFLFNVLHTGGGIVADVLNALLLFPLTISLVLASTRLLPAIPVAVLLPPAVELIQAQLPGRSCAITDMITNGAGALLGIAVGWAIQRWLRQPRPRRPTSASDLSLSR
jgi:VanZ family protein